MALQLYSYWRSSAAYRVRIALGLKGLDYETLSTDLVAGAHKADAYRLTNPQGLVPALVHDGTTIAQSLAIIEYLDETFAEPPLLPGDPLQRATVRAMAQAIACDIHPLNNLRVMNYLKAELGHPDADVNVWYGHWIHEGFAGLEQLVGQHSASGRYCFGDAPTLADTCLVPQIFNARRFNIDISGFPRLLAVDAHLTALPAFVAAAPGNQPDAPDG